MGNIVYQMLKNNSQYARRKIYRTNVCILSKNVYNVIRDFDT